MDIRKAHDQSFLRSGLTVLIKDGKDYCAHCETEVPNREPGVTLKQVQDWVKQHWQECPKKYEPIQIKYENN